MSRREQHWSSRELHWGLRERAPLLGILGGGQLAQMLALAAIPLGVRVRVLEPDPAAPARLCAEHRAAPYDDPAGLAWLAECDAVTLEFENVPVAALDYLAGRVPVRPGAALLFHTKHRGREKAALHAAGVGTATWRAVEAEADLTGALDALGGGGILKTSELGYDGKGQRRVGSERELRAAWDELGRVPCVLEGLVPFERELSLAVARTPGGDLAYGPLVENVHQGGILRSSRALTGAAQETQAQESQARELAARVATHLELEGLLTLELFEVGGGLLVNELAPRVHNSGHLTGLGGVSQFAAQVRAVLGLPLRDWAPDRPAAMVNIVGQEQVGQERGGQPWLPDLAVLDALPGAALHLYHKGWRAGRKLGHLNLTAASEDELAVTLRRAEALLWPQA